MRVCGFVRIVDGLMMMMVRRALDKHLESKWVEELGEK